MKAPRKGERPSPAERAVLRSNARDCLVKAAAALTESPTHDNLAFALILTGTALVHLVAADADGKVFARVAPYLSKFGGT